MLATELAVCDPLRAPASTCPGIVTLRCPQPLERRRKNNHLSPSRIKRYENCPRSWKYGYVDGIRSDSGPAAAFGTLLHAVFEDLFQWMFDEEITGAPPIDVATEIYQANWQASGLTTLELYREGLEIMRSYIVSQPPLEAHQILCVEEEWELQAGRFPVVGRFDRVDRVGDRGAKVIDYKSNRMLFSEDELENDLQMSLYGLAVKAKWPWVEEIEFEFHMLRHRKVQYAKRTPAELTEALAYVEAMGERMEADEEYKPNVTVLCGYCDYRMQCPAYLGILQEASAPDRPRLAVLDDMTAVALQREKVATYAKILYRRKDELDDVIKAALQDQDVLEVPGAGVKYKLVSRPVRTYPIKETIAALTQLAGLPFELVATRILAIENGKLDALLTEQLAELDPKRRAIVTAKIQSLAVTKASDPYVSPSKLKTSGKLSPAGSPQLPESNEKPAKDPSDT